MMIIYMQIYLLARIERVDAAFSAEACIGRGKGVDLTLDVTRHGYRTVSRNSLPITVTPTVPIISSDAALFAQDVALNQRA
jgi:hypothetical protein